MHAAASCAPTTVRLARRAATDAADCGAAAATDVEPAIDVAVVTDVEEVTGEEVAAGQALHDGGETDGQQVACGARPASAAGRAVLADDADAAAAGTVVEAAGWRDPAEVDSAAEAAGRRLLSLRDKNSTDINKHVNRKPRRSYNTVDISYSPHISMMLHRNALI